MKAKLASKTNFSCNECQCKNKSVFCSLTDDELLKVSGEKTIHQYKKGDVIFSENSVPCGVYCINDGKIKLSRVNDNGKNTITRIVGMGDMLGQQSFFDQKYFNETATALENTTVCFINKNYITKLMESQPTVAMNIIAHLGREMASIEEKLSYFFTKGVRERLAHILFEFSHKYGARQFDERILLDIKLSREEMASLVGVATETLIRFMSEFKEDKIIEQEGKKIFIKDLVKLKQIAG